MELLHFSIFPIYVAFNGHFRTPLHWAAKRGHRAIVSLLLANGADITAVTAKGETPAALSSNSEIQTLLGMEPGGITISTEASPNLPITPYYLKHQPLNGRVDLSTSASLRRNTEVTQTNCIPVINPAVKAAHQPGGSTQNDGKL
jgi:ankyrin repeat protein